MLDKKTGRRSATKAGTKIEWIESPHKFTKKNAPSRVKTITTVVIHFTGSPSKTDKDMAGDISWFQNPASKASAHYIIGAGGRIVQMVSESDRAYHAGVSIWNEKKNVNDFSIGIELDGKYGTIWPVAQLESLYELCADLMLEYGLTLDDFTGHEHVATPKGRKTDPGPTFEWVTFRRGVRSIIDPSSVSPAERKTTIVMEPLEISVRV